MILKLLRSGQVKCINLTEPTNLLTVLRRLHWQVPAVCNGNGTCGKCRIRFLEDAPPPCENERNALAAGDLSTGWRLACQIVVDRDMSIECPEAAGDLHILMDTGPAVSSESDAPAKQPESRLAVPDPPVRRIRFHLDAPAVDDQRDDWTRVRDAIRNAIFTPLKTAGVNSPAAPRRLTISQRACAALHGSVTGAIQSSGGWLCADLYGADDAMDALHQNQTAHILGFRSGDPASPPLGAAIDIGSTTVAAYLYDLESGRQMAVRAASNPQCVYGADVISRIHHTMTEPDGTALMQRAILGCINDLLEQLVKPVGCQTGQIRNLVIAGNTVMCHFVLGLPTESIAAAPFAPVILDPVSIPSTDLGLHLDGIVTLMPGIASYVGSDITAGILSCGLDTGAQWSLLLDLGTNGEVALGRQGQILACATAAGPAFEGASIQHGTGAVPGAISAIDLSRIPGWTTVAHQPPIGICGSGVLDAAAELCRYGIIDETGRMQDSADIPRSDLAARVRSTEGRFAFEIARSGGRSIVFTEKDVREVQLAKAAVRAGIEILMAEAGISVEQIGRLYIAGGFGNFMNIESAAAIGLFPPELKNRAVAAGNCAGSGAGQYLLSRGARTRCLEIVSDTRYIELSTHPAFMDHYISAMMFE